MNVYIFSRIDKLTNSYHNEGGLVVIARDRTEALTLLKNAGDKYGIIDPEAEITEEEWKRVQVYKLMGNEEPRLFVFPDDDCCYHF